jgi:adenylate cyclase
MAVWGAPYPDTAHAERACQAAIEQRDLIQRLNVTLSAKYGVTIQVRMGINSGMVTAGNMGSDKKFQYTVMGDVVNLAARMEAANKEFGTDIIIGENTRKLLGPEMIVRTLGRVIPVGRTLGMIVYALEGHKRSITDRRLKVISLYEQALECFFQRDWKSCLRLLDESLALEHDIPAVILRTRARDYQMEPPGADWHGEYVQKEKD